MRAVSLSNAAVQELLHDRFVCTWTDITADPNAGASHPHACTDQASDLARGLGEHNTQTLILTPDGRLLTALAGYIGPEDLLEELKFADSLWAAVHQADASGGKQLVAQAHRTFAQDLAQRKPKDGTAGAQEQFFGQVRTVGAKRAAADHEFSATNALMPAGEFTTALMVGTEKSAFVSRTSTSTIPPTDLPIRVPAVEPFRRWKR
jgi:hypothetical protein